MRELYRTILRVAPAPLPILIEGPTGAGKELVAQTLHQESRRKGPLIAFSVAALSESLFESELFGHVRGAFTGAVYGRPGLLRQAHNGTAFFDEIGELSLTMQAKLLRALESGKFHPVGSETEVSANFRIVAATNMSLVDAVSNGKFRSDLWYRLHGITIQVPPLCEHSEDIPALVEHFLIEFHHDGWPTPTAITDRAMARLQQYLWPGNIRELKHTIRCLVVCSNTAVIEERDVDLFLPGLTGTHHHTLNAHTKSRIQLLTVLQNHQWNINAAATALKINRSTLYRRMKRLEIQTPRWGNYITS